MSREMKIITIFIPVIFIFTSSLTEVNSLRHRRVTNDLKSSYIVHYNYKGEPLTVAGFHEFVRALNGQRGISSLEIASYAKSPEFPALQAIPTIVSELMTTTEATTSHQPKPLATGTSRIPGTIITTTESPKSAYVTTGTTAIPLKLPHEMSGTSSPVPEASVSTDKPMVTLEPGQNAAVMSVFPKGPSPSLVDVSNLVTPSENSPSKITVSGLGFSRETGLNSKVISLLQPGVQTVLNYPQPQVSTIHGYLPVAQTSYVQTVPTTFQKPAYLHSTQPDIFNYASYPNQNLAISDGNAQLQIVRQAPSLIDIGQGLGQGYRSTAQELPVNLGGWGGVDYSAQRSISPVKPALLDVTNSGYMVPVSSPALSKIGFGLRSW